MAKPFISTTKFQVSINKTALLNSVTTGRNGKVTGREVRSYVLPIIEEAQRDLIKDFHNHAITREIKSGPTSSNSSGTLGGYGNLFSFIGFETKIVSIKSRDFNLEIILIEEASKLDEVFIYSGKVKKKGNE